MTILRNRATIEGSIVKAETLIQEACDKLLVIKAYDFSGSETDATTNINNFLSDIVSQIKGVSLSLKEKFLPDFLYSCRTYVSDDKVNAIDLIVRTKLNSEVKVKNKVKIYTTENFKEQVIALFKNTILSIYAISLAEDNIKAYEEQVGNLLARTKLDIPFDISFVYGDKGVVQSINNEGVVLQVSKEKAFDLANSSIFEAPLEKRPEYIYMNAGTAREQYPDMDIDENLGNDELVTVPAPEGYVEYVDNTVSYITDFVEKLKVVQTPVQMLRVQSPILTDAIESLSTKKMSTILKETFNKNILYMVAKQGIGYFRETVKVAEEEVDVFCLVEKNTVDKVVEYKEIIKPFNVDTLDIVDFDVVSYIKSNSDEALAE